MGIVYKARHIGLNRVVALKMMQGGLGTAPEAEARFRREAKAVARLQHPNIVQIYEIGESAGVPFLALEFVEHGSLAQHVQGQPQPARASAQLVEVLARAMHFAHQHGIVHRDLKPANILLVNGESAPDTTQHSLLTTHQPKITDFGLAKWMDRETAATQSGTILGTPSYMAPEQVGSSGAAAARRAMEVNPVSGFEIGFLVGQKEPVFQGRNRVMGIGPAADVYSLGAILYELLTGRPPFHAETPVETVVQVVHEEPVLPRRLRPRLERDLETICLRCLEKEPASRYPSALALADDLHRFLDGEPIQARPVSRGELLWRWRRRNPVVAALLAGLVTVFVTGFAAVTWKWLEADREAKAKEKALGQEEQERVAKESAFAEAQTHLYNHRIVLAHREWLANHVAQADELLDACPPKLRAWEWHYLKRQCHGETFTLSGHTNGVYGLAYSPDGRQLASAGYGGEVIIWDAATGRRLASLEGSPQSFSQLTFSQDRRYLAGAYGMMKGGAGTTWVYTGQESGEVYLWDLALGKTKWHIRGDAMVRGVAFDPQGRFLLAADSKGLIKFLEMSDGREAKTFHWPCGALTCMAVSPDRRYLAAGSLNRMLSIWDVNAQIELHSYPQSEPITSLAFMPDGRRLAMAFSQQNVKVLDPFADRQELSFFAGSTGSVLGIACTPDGRHIITSGGSALVTLWNAETGREWFSLRGAGGRINSFALSPDGRQLATSAHDNFVRIWTLTPHESRSLAQSSKSFVAQDVNADGSRWAVVKDPQTIMVFDPRTGQELQEIKGDFPSVFGMKYSPDGRHLALFCSTCAIKVLEAGTGKLVTVFQGHVPNKTQSLPIFFLPNEKWGFVFSSDGRRVASNCNGRIIKIWSAQNGTELLTIQGHQREVISFTFSPDGRYLASTSNDKTLKLWNANTGEELHSFSGQDSYFPSATFSRDSQLLASASFDGRVRIWDLAAGKEIRTLRGHSGMISHTAFSPDGRRLASAGWDSVKVWDMKTGQELLALSAQPTLIERLFFTDDGSRLFLVGGGGRLQVWEGNDWQFAKN